MATYQQRGKSKSWRAIIRKKGKSRSRGGFPTKTSAREWATRIEHEINTGGIHDKRIPPKGLTIAAVIDDYTDTVSPNKPFGRSKAATLKMLKRELGHIDVKDIDDDLLTDFVDRRRLQGAGGVTIGVDLSNLTTLFKWARVRRKLNIPLEPIQDCREIMRLDGIRTKSAERDRRLQDGELDALFAHWESKKRQIIPMVDICKFAIATGMRQSEITRIQWDDLDADKKTVVIRERKHPKEPKDETVPLLDAAGYDAWALIQSQTRKGPRIFPFNRKSVSSSFTRACKALKIEDLHFHDLRHEATSRLFEAGYQIQEVALVTGHKDWKMLQRYTQLRPEDLHRD